MFEFDPLCFKLPCHHVRKLVNHLYKVCARVGNYSSLRSGKKSDVNITSVVASDVYFFRYGFGKCS